MSNHNNIDIKANITYRNLHIGQPIFIYESQDKETESISIPELSLQQEVLFRADSPEPIPPSAAALFNPGPNQEVVVLDIVGQFCGPMEDNGGQSLRQEPTMSDSVDEAIPALPW